MKNKYRSFLFVPATDKLLNKIPVCKADVIIIDLEDSIPEVDKSDALKRAIDFLSNYSYECDVFVRVNSDNFKNEILALDCLAIKGYMLPKTEGEADINKISALTSKEIIALIESAKGIVNIDTIAQNARVTMIAFGAEDFTSQNGIENDDMFLSYPKSRIVLYAKANKKWVIDTMSLVIHDTTKYRELAINSRKFGFDAKLAIHPMQVDVINEVFSEDIKHYKDIVTKYEKSALAVVEIGGKIYEKPHIDAMKRKIKEYYND